MLPPIPHSLVPVTVQQDVVKPRPEIPPVTATAESSKESGVSLDKRHPQEAEMLLREEQRRRQRRPRKNWPKAKWPRQMKRRWASCPGRGCGWM
jgi:hypothetical protein